MTLNRGDIEVLEAFLADAGPNDDMTPAEFEALQRVVEHCRGTLNVGDRLLSAAERARGRQPIIQREGAALYPEDPIVVALGKIGASLDRMEQHMRSRR